MQFSNCFRFRFHLCSRLSALVGACSLICAFNALLPMHAFAQDSESVPAPGPGMEALQRFFHEIQTFNAEFTQVVLDENFTVIDRAAGQVWVQRPGQFRWDYAPPQAQQIIGDGERVWLYDVELEQVTVRKQKNALGSAPAELLSGASEVDIRENYAIEELGVHGRLQWMSLRPLEEDTSFTEVRIGFEDQRLRTLELLDTFSQRTRIVFTNFHENTPIASSLFAFVAPSGVDVIDQD